MPSLKSLRNRINSVKSTRKITSAMKMVAASKLKRAQTKAEAARPYAQSLGKMLKAVLATTSPEIVGSKLMSAAGDRVQLLVVISSDRGLCGGFNGNLIRHLRAKITELESVGKVVKLITVGRKAKQLLTREHGSKIVHHYQNLGKNIPFSEVQEIGETILNMLEKGEFDQCHFVYNEFISVISQEVRIKQVIPFSADSTDGKAANKNLKNEATDGQAASEQYEFEPDEEAILESLLPKNFLIQLYQAVLESAAGEQGARMSAMDNATRNAGDMIKKLTLNYNRTRQAVITKELIEIISGAEAV